MLVEALQSCFQNDDDLPLVVALQCHLHGRLDRREVAQSLDLVVLHLDCSLRRRPARVSHRLLLLLKVLLKCDLLGRSIDNQIQVLVRLALGVLRIAFLAVIVGGISLSLTLDRLTKHEVGRLGCLDEFLGGVVEQWHLLDLHESVGEHACLLQNGQTAGSKLLESRALLGRGNLLTLLHQSRRCRQGGQQWTETLDGQDQTVTGGRLTLLLLRELTHGHHFGSQVADWCHGSLESILLFGGHELVLGVLQQDFDAHLSCLNDLDLVDFEEGVEPVLKGLIRVVESWEVEAGEPGRLDGDGGRLVCVQTDCVVKNDCLELWNVHQGFSSSRNPVVNHSGGQDEVFDCSELGIHLLDLDLNHVLLVRALLIECTILLAVLADLSEWV